MSYKKSLFIGLTAVGLSSTSIGTAYAQPDIENPNPVESGVEAEQNSILSKVENHIGFDGEQFFVDDEKSIQEILTDNEFETLKEQLSERNAELQSLINDARSNPELNLIKQNDGVVVTKQSEQSGEFTVANAGETSINFGLSRVTINLSERDVQAVIDAGASGGGAAIGTALGIKSGPGAAITGAALSAIAASLVQSYANAVPLSISVGYFPPYIPLISTQ